MKKGILAMMLSVSLIVTGGLPVAAAKISKEDVVSQNEVPDEETPDSAEEMPEEPEGDDLADPESRAEIQEMQKAEDTLYAAQNIALGVTVNGSIAAEGETVQYNFALPGSGRVTLDFTSYMHDYTVILYDAAANQLWTSYGKYWNESLGYRQDSYELDLVKGNYYFEIKCNAHTTGSFSFCANFSDAGETCAEPNDTFLQAANISLPATVKGQIALNDEQDIYRVSIPKSGCLRLNITSYMKYYRIRIYDGHAALVWDSTDQCWNENLRYRTDQWDIDLKSGEYYIEMRGGNKGLTASTRSTGNYTLGFGFAEAGESGAEPNNDFSHASVIGIGSMVCSQIAANDEIDIYKVYIPSAGKYVFHITSYMKYYRVRVYNSNARVIWDSNQRYRNESLGYGEDSYQLDFPAGYNYIQVDGCGRTGISHFSLCASIPISKTSIGSIPSVEYNGKLLHPPVKLVYGGNTLVEGKDYKIEYEDNRSVGRGSVKIEGIGNYTGTVYRHFHIIPGKVSLLRPRNVSPKSVYVSWKTKSGSEADGYELWRSTKKNKGYKKVKAIKGAYSNCYTNKKLKKNKTYYFKARAYKIVNGKKYYGNFGNIKKVKIKK